MIYKQRSDSNNFRLQREKLQTLIKRQNSWTN